MSTQGWPLHVPRIQRSYRAWLQAILRLLLFQRDSRDGSSSCERQSLLLILSWVDQDVPKTGRICDDDWRRRLQMCFVHQYDWWSCRATHRLQALMTFCSARLWIISCRLPYLAVVSRERAFKAWKNQGHIQLCFKSKWAANATRMRWVHDLLIFVRLAFDVTLEFFDL